MEYHVPGYERVLHENPNWNSTPEWTRNPPIGTRGNPSGAKLEGPCPTPVTDTAKWLAPRKGREHKMKHVIVANMPDGTEALLINVETDNPDIDPVDALKQAAKDFLGTTDGKEYVERTNATNYNWEDLVSSIPDEITEKHGVIITSTNVTHYVVNHDERLTED
ncbi:MAG: hypothetical protein HDQ88_01240 [Clostridia bacterium]|nr:hypothetical protein [Clostridia bacterium]